MIEKYACVQDHCEPRVDNHVAIHNEIERLDIVIKMLDDIIRRVNGNYFEEECSSIEKNKQVAPCLLDVLTGAADKLYKKTIQIQEKIDSLNSMLF